MKEIAYHGGVVTFRLPAHWREESDDNDSGVFFSGEPDAGTLRLSVITMRSPSGVNAQTPRLLLEELGSTRKIEDVGDGHALASYQETSTEDGQAIRLHFWELAHAVPPDHARIAVFSFTIRTDQASDPGVRRDLAMLAAELRRARFARELGVIGP